MNENDLRDCFAMFAMNGLIARSGSEFETNWLAKNAYAMADSMLEARKPKEKDDEHEEDVGIARVAPKRNYRRKS
jgi:hypothetical protein